MKLVQKFRATFIRNWVCSNFVESPFLSSKILFSQTLSFHITQNPRLYSTKGTARTEKSEDSCGTSSANGDKKTRISSAIRKQAQNALLEYFYGTRNLQFTDAENMSKNAPQFLGKLLKKIDTEADVGRSITRFLRYHPINEFEPFFESLGLDPPEYGPLLPRDLMFLSDDALLLENYNVLSNYGIARNKIGKIYKEAIEVFRYGYGVLPSKLQAYEELGLNRSFMCKVTVCSPSFLVGDVNMKFIKVLEILKSMGTEISWVEEQLSEQSSYDWSMMLDVLSLFSEMGCGYEELGGLISQHPGLIFESSGDRTLTLVGFQIKFGSTMNEICSMFQHFPQIQIEKFVFNFRKCVQFLHKIEMKADEIGKIVRSHPLLLGTCTLKKTNRIFANLNVGKKQLCNFIQENPQELKKLVLGSRFGPLPNTGEELGSKLMKTKFLLYLGYEENSNSMNKALKVFRGKGTELQERFDCLVKAGLDRNEVCEIVRIFPHILNQTKDALEMKIDFLLNELSYPISTLVTFHSCLNYTSQRIKLRLSMYNWLKDQGKADPMLNLSTLVSCSENIFLRRYVKRHPKGPQVWKDLKKQIYPE